MRGDWNLELEGGSTTMSEGDTCLIRPNLAYKVVPVGSKDSSLFRVTKTNDAAGPTGRN